MNCFRNALLIFLISFAFALAKKKDKKEDSFPRTKLQEVTTCMGQSVDIRGAVETSAQECMDARIQELQEQIEVSGNGNNAAKKKQKLEKKKEKLAKKIRKKCSPECELKTFDLIPDVNGTDAYPSVDIPDSFLKIFPQDAHGAMKMSMQACYNTTSPMEGEEKKEKMCFTNIRLIKCLNKAVKKTCKGKPGSVQSPATPSNGTSTAKPKYDSEEVSMSTVSPSDQAPAADDSENDDDEADDEPDNEDDDDDSDNEENTATTNSPGKVSTPSTPVNLSQPIT